MSYIKINYCINIQRLLPYELAAIVNWDTLLLSTNNATELYTGRYRHGQTGRPHPSPLAMIHSRLDYCNGLLACPPAWQMTRLQSVLRAAARFVLQLPGCAPVSAAMRDSLHWLTFPQRVTYKLCLLTYKCLHGLAPPYLARMCVPVSALPGRSQLRAADKHFLSFPRTRTVTLGPRAFCSSSPASWNSLPAYLRDPALSINVFRERLKTVLFAA